VVALPATTSKKIIAAFFGERYNVRLLMVVELKNGLCKGCHLKGCNTDCVKYMRF
jgi:hypothetical protein